MVSAIASSALANKAMQRNATFVIVGSATKWRCRLAVPDLHACFLLMWWLTCLVARRCPAAAAAPARARSAGAGVARPRAWVLAPPHPRRYCCCLRCRRCRHCYCCHPPPPHRCCHCRAHPHSTRLPPLGKQAAAAPVACARAHAPCRHWRRRQQRRDLAPCPARGHPLQQATRLQWSPGLADQSWQELLLLGRQQQGPRARSHPPSETPRSSPALAS